MSSYNYALLSLPAYYILSVLPHSYAATIATNGDISKLDNSNPHGSSAASRTKSTLSPSAFAKYERAEACHRNCMENMPFFYVSVIAGLLAEKQTGRDLGVQTFAAAWMASRLVYVANYIVTESKTWSFLRSAAYFVGVGLCTRMCWRAAVEMA
ncbi:hypothetical protein MBLNU230_g2264t1 [Neophaeotheca triangularis]